MTLIFDPVQLVPITQLTTSFVSYRVVSEANGVLIRQIVANNNDSGAQTFDITLDGATGADSKILYRAENVPAGATIILRVHDVIVSGEDIGIKASAASAVNIMISGIKLSA